MKIQIVLFLSMVLYISCSEEKVYYNTETAEEYFKSKMSGLDYLKNDIGGEDLYNYYDSLNRQLSIEDKQKTRSLLIKSAKAGNPKALYELAYNILHYSEYGDSYQDFGQSPQDSVEALLNKSGLSQSYNLIGELYYEGFLNQEKNYSKAIGYFSKAAEKAYPSSCAMLMNMYFEGRGTVICSERSYYYATVISSTFSEGSHYYEKSKIIKTALLNELDMKTIEKVWSEVDSLLEGRMYYRTKELDGSIGIICDSKEDWDRAYQDIRNREKKYRQKIREQKESEI